MKPKISDIQNQKLIKRIETTGIQPTSFPNYG